MVYYYEILFNWWIDEVVENNIGLNEKFISDYLVGLIGEINISNNISFSRILFIKLDFNCGVLSSKLEVYEVKPK